MNIDTKNLALSNIEYLCLKMAAHPGKSARWYLRALHTYRFGYPGTGSWCAIYLNPSGKYRYKYFIDHAQQSITYVRWTTGDALRSSCGSFKLTSVGLIVARQAAVKIGLNPSLIGDAQ